MTEQEIWEGFERDLTHAIKFHGIDSRLGLLDYQISEDVVRLLKAAFYKYTGESLDR